MALGGSTGLGSGCLCNSLAVGLSRKLKTEYLSLRTFGTPTRVELQCKTRRHSSRMLTGRLADCTSSTLNKFQRAWGGPRSPVQLPPGQTQPKTLASRSKLAGGNNVTWNYQHLF